jgi:hypothetical protein
VESRSDTAGGTEPGAYEPPQVEQVLSRDQLEREILYAGTFPVSQPN